jgi:GH25 family lysozyme M1 (1,4-beta-N-acetylmuramidase)
LKPFRALAALSALFGICLTATIPAAATEFFRPWADPKRAIVLDGYEHNIIDFSEVVTDKRVTAFIHKGSDGMPPPYWCKGEELEKALCRQTWQRYAVGKELYQTRRMLAKSLGLKWGAYHLARAGDPIAQVDHFLDYAEPEDDEVVVLDIEGLNSEKWMSLEDADRFAIRLKQRIGRYPVLYVNELVAKQIAANAGRYKVLSRLPLWYARYKPEIRGAFPKGNWDSYLMWQFAYYGNCRGKKCPYRVPGTDRDIDVSVVDMTPARLRAAWPFGELAEQKIEPFIPIPMARPAMPLGEPTVLLASAGRWDMPVGTREARRWMANKVSAYLEYGQHRNAVTARTRSRLDVSTTNSIGGSAFDDLY